MNEIQQEIYIKKEAIKFSSAHMSVFPDGSKEALHGHNFSVELSVEMNSHVNEEWISFADYKKILKKICDNWDEKVLIAERCPLFQVLKKDQNEIEFLLCKKRYVFPRDEVVLLPTLNTTTEALAEEAVRIFLSEMKLSFPVSLIKSIKIRIDESPGQGASVKRYL